MDRVMRSKKSIVIFGYKQWLLSIDMKTKVVQHVPWITFNVFKVFEFSGFQVFRFSSFQVFKFFKTFLVPSFCLTFRHFLSVSRLKSVSFSLTEQHKAKLNDQSWCYTMGVNWPKLSCVKRVIVLITVHCHNHGDNTGVFTQHVLATN